METFVALSLLACTAIANNAVFGVNGLDQDLRRTPHHHKLAINGVPVNNLIHHNLKQKHKLARPNDVMPSPMNIFLTTPDHNYDEKQLRFNQLPMNLLTARAPHHRQPKLLRLHGFPIGIPLLFRGQDIQSSLGYTDGLSYQVPTLVQDQSMQGSLGYSDGFQYQVPNMHQQQSTQGSMGYLDGLPYQDPTVIPDQSTQGSIGYSDVLPYQDPTMIQDQNTQGSMGYLDGLPYQDPTVIQDQSTQGSIGYSDVLPYQDPTMIQNQSTQGSMAYPDGLPYQVPTIVKDQSAQGSLDYSDGLSLPVPMNQDPSSQSSLGYYLPVPPYTHQLQEYKSMIRTIRQRISIPAHISPRADIIEYIALLRACQQLIKDVYATGKQSYPLVYMTTVYAAYVGAQNDPYVAAKEVLQIASDVTDKIQGLATIIEATENQACILSVSHDCDMLIDNAIRYSPDSKSLMQQSLMLNKLAAFAKLFNSYYSAEFNNVAIFNSVKEYLESGRQKLQQIVMAGVDLKEILDINNVAVNPGSCS